MTEKLQRAPKIAAILTGVVALFKDFKQQVFMDPTYRNFIEGKASMMNFGPPKEKGLDVAEGEKKILADMQPTARGWQSSYASHPAAKFQITIDKQHIPQQFQNIDVKPFDISGADLISKETFESWVNRATVLMAIKQQNPDSWPDVVKSVLDQVVSQVQAKLGQGK